MDALERYRVLYGCLLEILEGEEDIVCEEELQVREELDALREELRYQERFALIDQNLSTIG